MSKQSTNTIDELKYRLEHILAILPKIGSIKEQEVIDKIVENAQKLVDADHVHVRVINWETEDLVVRGYFPKDDFDHLYNFKYFKSIAYKKGMVGYVFNNTRSIFKKSPKDIQKNEYFESYFNFLKYELDTVKERVNFLLSNPSLSNRYSWNYSLLIENKDKLEDLTTYLENIESVMIVPLLLEKKPIGVLNAYRIKNNNRKRNDFEREDLIVFEHFANNVSIGLAPALHSSWLLKSAMWNPKREYKEKANVELLSKEVINEAKRLTGAKDAKIRFVDWKGEYLVPGFLSDIDSKKIDRRVLVREIGVCPAGKAAKDKMPFISEEDLQKNADFIEFSKIVEFYRNCYEAQLNLLNTIKQSKDPDVNFNYKGKIKSIPKKYTKIAENMINITRERREILKNSYDTPEYKNSLKCQIKSLEGLVKAWGNYIDKEIYIWHSEIAVPIMFGETLLGVLNVHSDKDKWFTRSDEEILQALSGRVAIAIMEYQKKIFSELQEIEQKMTADQNYFEFAKRLTEGVKKVAFLINKPENIFPLLYTCKNPLKPEELLKEKDFNKYFKFQPRSDAETEEKKLSDIPFISGGLGFKAIEQLNIELKKEEKDRKPVFIVRENVDDPISGSIKKGRERKVLTNVCLPLFFGEYVYGLLYVDIKERYFFTELEKDALNLFSMKAGTILRNLRGYPEESFIGLSEDLSGVKYTYDELFGAELIKECTKLNENQ